MVAHTADSSIGRADDCSCFVRCYHQVAGSIPAQQISFFDVVQRTQKNHRGVPILFNIFILINDIVVQSYSLSKEYPFCYS